MGEADGPEREVALAALAARCHGVVSRRQLEALGYSSRAIGWRVRTGRLHRLHRAVYAVGHPAVSADGHRLAGVLACGDGALASHVTAAVIWGLRHSSARVVHVILHADRGQRSRPGVRVHHTRFLPAADRAAVRGIPVTSIARTLADLGDVAPATHVRSAFAAAERLQLLDMDAIDEVLVTAAGRRRGARILREVLRGYDPRWSQTRSDLELAMLDLAAAHGLPAPEVNTWVADRYIADFLWRAEGLVVEADSDLFHRSATARRADARRDHDLRRHGFAVVRCHEDDVAGAPVEVAARISEALLDRRRRPLR